MGRHWGLLAELVGEFDHARSVLHSAFTQAASNHNAILDQPSRSLSAIRVGAFEKIRASSEASLQFRDICFPANCATLPEPPTRPKSAGYLKMSSLQSNPKILIRHGLKFNPSFFFIHKNCNFQYLVKIQLCQ
jgi:hypothetical protein